MIQGNEEQTTANVTDTVTQEYSIFLESRKRDLIGHTTTMHLTRQIQVVRKELMRVLKLNIQPEMLQAMLFITALFLRREMTLGMPEHRTIAPSLIHSVKARMVKAFTLRWRRCYKDGFLAVLWALIWDGCLRLFLASFLQGICWIMCLMNRKNVNIWAVWTPVVGVMLTMLVEIPACWAAVRTF